MTKEGEGLKGVELEDKLTFDLDEDLEADDMARPGPGTLRRSSHRLRFPPFKPRLRPTLERLMRVSRIFIFSMT